MASVKIATAEMNITPQLDVECWGAPRDCGAMIGDALAERITKAAELLGQYEAFRVLQPWWMPYSLYLYLAQWRASDHLAEPIQRVLPAASDRLLGMADGAKVTPETLYLFHALETATPQIAPAAVPLAACTAVGVSARRSAVPGPIVHHNFDNVPLTLPLFVVRRRREAGRYRCLEFSMSPLAGAIDGINEHGLSITYDFAWSINSCPPAPPLSMAISEALGTCRNVTEAAKFFSSGVCSGGGMLLVADADDGMGRLELAGDRIAWRRARREDVVEHSNTYRFRRMKRYEVGAETCYSAASPPALQGRRVLESPEHRDARFRQLLNAHQQKLIAPDDLIEWMGDHGPDGQASENTLCMHGIYWQTLASVQLMPRQREMRISYGPTCQTNFITLAV